MKDFIKGVLFALLIATTVSLFAESVWTNRGDSVSTHEVHNEQKIIWYGMNDYQTPVGGKVPAGWHVVSITNISRTQSLAVVIERN